MLLLSAVALFNQGCAHIVTNIPWDSNTVTVSNQTHHTLEVAVNGNPVGVVPPGRYAPVEFSNRSGYTAEYSILVVAHDEEGNPTGGQASRLIYVSGYRRQSETWIVTETDLANGSSYGSSRF